MDRKSRAAINRNNATKSTGPKSAAGKNAAKYNALKHGLDSRRILDINGLSDTQAIAALRISYESEYRPQTLAETETVESMIETQWQLTRVRRLLDLAFLQGGDLLTTSKIVDNFSRHQTRLHRIYKDLVIRVDDLLIQRAGFVSQNPQPDPSGFVSQKGQPNVPQPPGFVSQINQPKDLQAIGFVPQNAPTQTSSFPNESPTNSV